MQISVKEIKACNVNSYVMNNYYEDVNYLRLCEYSQWGLVQLGYLLCTETGLNRKYFY